MTVEDAVLEKLKVLPNSRKQDLLNFADSLVKMESVRKPRRNLYGALADLDTGILEQDFSEARKEAWKNFPRDHFFSVEEK